MPRADANAQVIDSGILRLDLRTGAAHPFAPGGR